MSVITTVSCVLSLLVPRLFIILCLGRAMFNAITKTRLYNCDPLKPHFYIVKLGFTGVYIFCCYFANNIGFRSSLEPPGRGGSNEYPQSMF